MSFERWWAENSIEKQLKGGYETNCEKVWRRMINAMDYKRRDQNKENYLSILLG
jgi:hypothetical protein